MHEYIIYIMPYSNDQIKACMHVHTQKKNNINIVQILNIWKTLIITEASRVEIEIESSCHNLDADKQPGYPNRATIADQKFLMRHFDQYWVNH